MKFGVVFPQTELSHDPDALPAIARAVEQLEFDSLLFYDHVVGAEHADREPPLSGPLTQHDPFHDPFVAMGFAAAITSRIELATGVLILPQRRPCSSRSRRPTSTCCQAVDSGSVSGPGGTGSSTTRSDRTSRAAGGA